MKNKLFFLLILFALNLWCINLKQLGKTKLSQKDNFLKSLGHICVTEDDLFIITDSKDGNMKIYNSDGQLIKVWGKKGPGPGELHSPMLCDYEKGRLVIMDWGKRKIFICDRKSKTDFEIIDGIFCLNLGFDICLRDEMLLISGSRDIYGKGYELYILNLENKKYVNLISREVKYNFSTLTEFRNEFRNQPDIVTIGIGGFCDWWDDSAYLVWEGDLRIIEVNIKSKKRRIFGKKTDFFIKPYASRKLIEAHSHRNFSASNAEKARMSYTRAVFAGSKYVGIVYSVPIQKKRKHDFMIQFYDKNGHFIKEIELPGLRPPYYRFYFQKDKNRFFFMNSEPDEYDESEEHFVICGYQIVE